MNQYIINSGIYKVDNANRFNFEKKVKHINNKQNKNRTILINNIMLNRILIFSLFSTGILARLR